MSVSNTDKIRKYYDDFLCSNMIEYRIDGNKRIEAAIGLLRRFIRPDSVIADIGCGIGIIAEAIAKIHKDARIFGVDISDKNIEYAEKTVSAPNVRFLAADATEQVAKLVRHSPRSFDIIYLVDVIEHIPESDRGDLFREFSQIASNDVRLIMTYPSPVYQKYLVENEPDKLQIVDNVIELETILAETQRAGWQLEYFSYVDVWTRNQYCHAVFKRSISLEHLDKPRISFATRVAHRLDRLILRPKRVQKYAKRPFEKEDVL